MPERDHQAVDMQSTAAGILARLWWMLFGNAVLAFCLVFILENRGGFFRAADWVFWVTTATLVLVRHLDITLFDGQTAAGAPASTAHWVRYVAWLVPCSTVAWLPAHAANALFVREVTPG